MVKVPDSKLKCFMRTGKNGAVYRTCATPEKNKKPKKQVRGDPKPASERKLPYLTTKGKKLPKSDRVIKDDKPKKPPLPPKSDKVKKRQEEIKKKKFIAKKGEKVKPKEEKKQVKIKPKKKKPFKGAFVVKDKKGENIKLQKRVSDNEVIRLLIAEMDINKLTNEKQRKDMKKSIKEFYNNGAKNDSSKLKTERPFKVAYQKSIRGLDDSINKSDEEYRDNLVAQFRVAYLRGMEVAQSSLTNKSDEFYRKKDIQNLLQGKDLPNDSHWDNEPLDPENLDFLADAFEEKWYKAT